MCFFLLNIPEILFFTPRGLLESDVYSRKTIAKLLNFSSSPKKFSISFENYYLFIFTQKLTLVDFPICHHSEEMVVFQISINYLLHQHPQHRNVRPVTKKTSYSLLNHQSTTVWPTSKHFDVSMLI